MRRDVQEIFRNTPHGKQVMMFSATLSKDIRPVCKKFMQDVNFKNQSTKFNSKITKPTPKNDKTIGKLVKNRIEKVFKFEGWEKFLI